MSRPLLFGSMDWSIPLSKGTTMGTQRPRSRRVRGQVIALLALRLVPQSPESSAYFADAACSINFATALGWETITTCEPPLTTTLFFAPALLAMNAMACGGMFLSSSP